MKTPTMSELQNRIKEIESDMIDNWGDWGDVNPVSRLMTIRKLARIRRALSKPVRVDFSTGNENYSDYCRECGKEFRLDVYIKARKK